MRFLFIQPISTIWWIARFLSLGVIFSFILAVLIAYRMSPLTKVVNGKTVTNTNVKPPTGWTVNYDDFGSDTEWGEDGEVADLVSPFGIQGQVKPLFRTPYRSNEVIFVIEINAQYYIYNGESGWVQRIVTPTDLKAIVEFINEEGWFRLETESLG